MHMISGDLRFIQVVAFSVEVAKARVDECVCLWKSKDGRSPAPIEPPLDLSSEAELEVFPSWIARGTELSNVRKHRFPIADLLARD